MSSKIEICNFALQHTGSDRTINSLNEDSKEAKLCARHYNNEVRQLLSSFGWSFAKRRTLLAQLENNNWEERYQFKYALPNDILKVLRIIPRQDFRYSEYKVPYNISGSFIFTDINPCALEYIADIANPSEYPVYFVNALALKLAAIIAINLTGDPDQRQRLMQMASQAMITARAHDANQEHLSWTDDIPGYVRDRY